MKSIALLFTFFLSLCSTAFAGEAKLKEHRMEYLAIPQDTIMTNRVLKEKDPVTALVLCTFLGPLGVHRIYLGTSVSTVVAYVLTGAGFGILWITDLILIIHAMRKDSAAGISNNRHYFLWNKP
jgi:TM2 domain-containing membrane protein YozV